MTVGKIVATTIGLITLGLAACATTQGNLTRSAERLEHDAYALEQSARRDVSTASYTQDAQDFAREARDFRRTIEDRRTDEREVEQAFQDLSRRYHALRDEVDRSNSRAAELDFRPVTEAYLDVEREMRHYSPRRERYAHDD